MSSVTREITYNINEETGCWECTSHKPDSHGYAVIRINKKRLLIHRHMYTLYKGNIPEGLMIRHTCDNPICINPNHLLTGTHTDNMRDAVQRGRHSIFKIKRKSKPPRKLTAENVIEIRTSSMSQRELAKKFNIGRGTVFKVKSKMTYKDI